MWDKCGMGMPVSGVMTHEELRKEIVLKLFFQDPAFLGSNLSYTSLILLTLFFSLIFC